MVVGFALLRRLVIKLEEAEDAYRDSLLQPVRNSRWQGTAAQDRRDHTTTGQPRIIVYFSSPCHRHPDEV